MVEKIKQTIKCKECGALIDVDFEISFPEEKAKEEFPEIKKTLEDLDVSIIEEEKVNEGGHGEDCKCSVCWYAHR